MKHVRAFKGRLKVLISTMSGIKIIGISPALPGYTSTEFHVPLFIPSKKKKRVIIDISPYLYE
jgi:hypothetical protein